VTSTAADGAIQVRDLGAMADTAGLVQAVLANGPTADAAAGQPYTQLLLPFKHCHTDDVPDQIRASLM
jgi:hypothetical protein